MNKDQFNCNQNVRFIFEFFEKREWASNEVQPLREITDSKNITARSVKNLADFLNERLLRIASMMEILQTAHKEWLITGKKDKIIMETNNFDFNDAISALSSKGFKDDEYILKLEYERKWGML